MWQDWPKSVAVTFSVFTDLMRYPALCFRNLRTLLSNLRAFVNLLSLILAARSWRLLLKARRRFFFRADFDVMPF